MFISRHKPQFFLGVLGVLLTLVGCATTQFTPLTTIDQVQERREKAVEDFVKQQLINQKIDTVFYESLAFGRMIMYKPDAFERLDSLYEIKYTFIKSEENVN
jgi:hypothetical protein